MPFAIRAPKKKKEKKERKKGESPIRHLLFTCQKRKKNHICHLLFVRQEKKEKKRSCFAIHAMLLKFDLRQLFHRISCKIIDT